jgi:predicted transposase YdaD
MPDHDHPHRLLFSHPDLVRDLITGFVGTLSEEVDLSTLERHDGTFVNERWQDRESDVIWRLRWQGRDLYIYLLIEFQSSIDSEMLLRLLEYQVALWRELRKTAPEGETTLPPVLPIVLYNGDPTWTAATDLHALTGNYPTSLTQFQPAFRYLLIDEQRLAVSDRLAERNVVAAICALEQADVDTHSARMVEIGQRIAEYLRASGRTQSLEVLVQWWDRTLIPAANAPDLPNPFQETRSMIAEKFNRFGERLRAEGVVEGKAVGLMEGEAKGEAKGKIAEIRRLVSRGWLSVDGARKAIHDLVENHEISEAQGQEALAQLG